MDEAKGSRKAIKPMHAVALSRMLSLQHRGSMVAPLSTSTDRWSFVSLAVLLLGFGAHHIA